MNNVAELLRRASEMLSDSSQSAAIQSPASSSSSSLSVLHHPGNQAGPSRTSAGVLQEHRRLFNRQMASIFLGLLEPLISLTASLENDAIETLSETEILYLGFIAKIIFAS